MRGTTYGLRITKARCRTRHKIKRNRLRGRPARPRGARADDPTTSWRLIACRTGQGFLVIEHRAEIAHVIPAFKRVAVDIGGRVLVAS
jgi:hypothetical protein